MGGSAAELIAPAQEAAGWDFACADWFEKLKAGRPPIPALPLDRAKADKAVGIYNNLRLPDVTGQPTLAEAGAEWFRDIVRAVAGSVDAAGVRHVPEVFLEVPKKNSKTTNAAALTLTLTLLNTRPYAAIYLVGPTQEIAETGFEQILGMIRADPEGYLQQRFHPQEHKKQIKDRVTGAVISVKTFDTNIVTGKKPSIVVVDELHLLGAKKYANRVITQLRGGLALYPDGLLMFITTQSDIPPAGVFKEELAQARAIRDGKYEGRARMLPVLYEFPEAIQTAKGRPWMDPKLWPLVQPNLGRPITIEQLASLFEAEKVKGEAAVRLWASQHLNIQIDLALMDGRWRGADYWEAAAVEGLDLEELLARAEVAVMGIDAGGLDDLFAACVAGRCRETRHWLYWVHAWADPTVLDLRKDIAPALKDFEEAGDLTLAETTGQALDDIVAIAERIRGAGLFPKEHGIGCDPAGIGALLDAFSEAGFDEPLVAGVAPQGYKLSSAVWSMERLLKDGAIEHGGQPLMNFAVGNAAAEQRGNSVHITKQIAGKAKIDPLIAAFIATKLLEANPAASAPPKPALYFV